MTSIPTTDEVQHKHILQRTFTGARWMLYLSASALVAGFFTNVILARTGAETLGFYSLLMLLVSLVQTFFVFGAANVLIQYIPTLSAEMRPRFVFTYTMLVFGFGLVLLGLCLLFPAIIEIVFRQELQIPIGMYLILLTPILLLQLLVWAMLQAELEGTILAISQNAVSWFYFVNVGVLLLAGALSASDTTGYIFGAVVAANVVALLVGVYFLKREYFRIEGSASKWFLPKGFWRFSLALHFGTLFNFVISNAAPVFILRELGLKELGYFRAAIVFAAFVSWIPSVFDKSFYPSFTNLISKNLPIDDVYQKFSRLNAMSSGMVALVIMLFTRELLGVFGKEFTEGSYFLLTMLAAGYVVSSPFVQVNFALVTAYLKTPHTMVAYAVAAVVAIGLYGVLVPRFQLHGIAVAFIALQLVMLLLSWILTRRFTHVEFPVRAFAITVCVVGVGLLGSFYFGTVSAANASIKLLLVSGFLLFLLGTKLLRSSDVKEMLSLVLPGWVLQRLETNG